MIIIIINGTSQVGKDKFVSIFNQKFPEFRVKNISSIDKVKSISEIAFGWNGKKDEKSRKFLSDIKRAWAEFNDGPTNYIFEKINIDINYCKLNNKLIKQNIYFIHIREPEEIEKVKNKYRKDCITLLIRKNKDHISNNYSDKNVENYKYDFIINNDGDISDLENNVIKFKEQIIDKY